MSVFSSSLKIDHDQVVAAIEAAEQRTSGEIRVVVAKDKVADPVVAAKAQFERLGMTATAERNGVLIYLAPNSHAFAVIGDTAIHEKCGESFWKLLAAAMELKFKQGAFTEGLVLGIQKAASVLAENFPRRPDDRNELPNRVEEA